VSMSRKALIARPARLFHQKTAVSFEGRNLSFGEVDDRSNRLANALLDMGVRARDNVATLMRNCLQYPEIEFALVKGGFCQITLNPRLTAAEQLMQIDETGAAAVIVQQCFADLIKDIRRDLKKVKYFICFDGLEETMQPYDSLLASASPQPPEGEMEPDDVGEIRYTSGTTGRPKGVMLPYKSRLAITRNLLMDHLGDLTSEDRFLALQPLYHGAGWFMHPVWIRGATHYIVPRYAPDIALDLIERERISVIKTVPTVLLQLLNSPEIRKRDLSSVKTIIYGGSPIPVERLKEALEIFGPVFVNLFGQLEAAMTISLLRKEEHTGKRLGSVGRPCTWVQVKVVNPAGQEVQPSEIGEVIVQGDNQMIGYLNRPAETAKAIRKGWIYTNDLGTVDEDGFIYLTGGRKSEMIISGGLNVYPGEVEQVFYKHPGVFEAGVIGIADPLWGEAVKACVVLKEGYTVSEQELLDFCKEHLADYKRPKSCDFFEKLPHTAAGKIMYGELRKQYKAES
jgi:long-chain acyl-CoA synthetase